MKKILMMAAVAMMATTVATAQEEQEEEVLAYFTTAEMPDMLHFLPAPPDTIGALFAHDIMQYMWGKTMRLDPERAAIAIRDAEYGLECIIREFSEPFGLQISKEETPEIYKVLLEGTATCDSICKEPKTSYGRTRPFARFNEHTLVPELEEELNPHKSFPSGHSLLGWSSALLMMEINPDRANQILARGYRYGENRLVVGAHWQSDTDAARMAAGVAYAKLHTSERFLEQMKKARDEFKRLTQSPDAVRQVEATRRTSDAEMYDLSGRKISSPSQGVYIQDGQKRHHKSL